jgi:hypothetical protein
MNATPSPRSAKRRPLLITLAVLVLLAAVALFLIMSPGPMAFSTLRIPPVFLRPSRKHH